MLSGFWRRQEQAELQKAARAERRSGEFMQGSSDPGRAYPCRIEYDIVKEQAWRKAWCADLEKQVLQRDTDAETTTAKLPPQVHEGQESLQHMGVLFFFPLPPRLLRPSPHTMARPEGIVHLRKNLSTSRC